MKSNRVLDPSKSQRGGIAGFFETLLRRFKTMPHMFMITLLYIVACVSIGLALIPGIILFQWVEESLVSLPIATVSIMSAWIKGATIVASVFLTGLCMILVLPLTNVLLLFRQRLKVWRGPYYSLEAIRWYIHNGVTYVMRYTLLEFFTPSPIAVLFYRLMGMKIGKGTVINTTAISDPSLITMGEKVTIGGSASIIGHYGQSGFLILAPVLIDDGATIGLKASIMGGVRIGKNALIMPHSVVLPKTQVPDGEIWGGVPAQKIESNIPN